VILVISGFKKKLPERFKVPYDNAEDQAADIFTRTFAHPLFEKFKKRLGLKSSSKM
jgi:hypothetical protein